MNDLAWSLIAALGATGIVMALLSALAGMRPRVENPAWWSLYLVWIAVTLYLGATPFFTILFASILAGILHAVTLSLLIGSYRRNNPWHAEAMSQSDARERRRFLMVGLGSGVMMGAIAGALAWAISLLL